MRALAAGDEQALAALLARYERPLASFISRQTGGIDVDDVYQETWMRVVRHCDRFDPERRFSTWLFQIAVNLCRDQARRAGREVVDHEAAVRTAEAGGARDGGPSRGGSSFAPGSDARIDADRLLARLPAEQREVLVLRYYHDFSEGRIAEIVGCPRGTVKSRIHNALARLSRLVAAEEAAERTLGGTGEDTR